MDNTKSRLDGNINSLFKNMSYFRMYNEDIWITILIFLVVGFVTIYFFFKNTIQIKKVNWESEKCNPLYMAYGSILNDGVSDNFNETNFKECTKNLLFGISVDLKNPISAIFSIFGGIIALASSVLSSIMGFILYLFNMIMNLFRQLLLIIQKLIASIKQTFEAVGNTVGHVLGFISVLYNQIAILIDSIKQIFPVLAASFMISVIIPTIAFLIFSIAMLFVGYALMASIFLSWLGGIIVSIFSIITVFCILMLILMLMILSVLLIAGQNIDEMGTSLNVNNYQILPVNPPTSDSATIELENRDD